MTPYRSRACVEIDDPSPKSGSEGFSGGGCPTCLSCVERSAEARRARKRSRWAAFFGTLAALALVATTLASFRGLQIAQKAMARHDRREARRAAKDLAQLQKALALLEHQPLMVPNRGRHHHHAHRETVPAKLTNVAPPFEAVMARGLAFMGAETHDPVELRRRADILAKAGLPVIHAKIRGGSLLKLLAATPSAISLTPVTTVPALRHAPAQGVRIGSVTAPLDATGIRNGDVLLSLNGTPLQRATDVEPALKPSIVSSPQIAVLELLREGRRTVLDVTFSD